jgi:hypothetical protein
VQQGCSVRYPGATGAPGARTPALPQGPICVSSSRALCATPSHYQWLDGLACCNITSGGASGPLRSCMRTRRISTSRSWRSSICVALCACSTSQSPSGNAIVRDLSLFGALIVSRSVSDGGIVTDFFSKERSLHRAARTSSRRGPVYAARRRSFLIGREHSLPSRSLSDGKSFSDEFVA